MQKKQIIAVLIGVILVVVLYTLPKVIVSDANKTLTQKANSPQDSLSPTSSHINGLSAKQVEQVKNLTNQYKNSIDKEKKIIFADSLAKLYHQAMMFDSVAYYRDVIAGLSPSIRVWLTAGDANYDAFFFVTEEQTAKIYGLKARQYYQKVLEKDSTQLDAKAKMAMTYANSDTPMQAVLMLREVIAKDSVNEQALFNLGLLSIRSGQYDKAVGRFEQILRHNPSYVQARLYLGVSYAKLGDKERARELLTKVKSETHDVIITNAADEYLKNL